VQDSEKNPPQNGGDQRESGLAWAGGGKSMPSRGMLSPKLLDYDLRHYFRLFVSHIWLILFCLLIFLALGAFQLSRTTPKYSSTATIMYEPSRQKVLDMDMQLGARPYYFRIDEMETAVEMIRSPKVAQSVIDALGLYASSTAKPDEPREESPLAAAKNAVSSSIGFLQNRLVNVPDIQADERTLENQKRIADLLGKVSVNQKRSTKLIEITVTDRDPNRAAEIANEFANQFISDVEEQQAEAFSYARRFLAEQIEETKQELEAAEKELYEFNSESDLKAMEETLKISIDTMVSLTKQIEETKNEIALYGARKEAAGSGSVRQTLISEDPYYTALLRQLSELQVKRISIAAENEPDYPQLRRIDLEISGIRDELTSATQAVLNDFGSRLQMAEITEKHLLDRLEQQKEKVHLIEGKMIDFRMLRRQVDSTREIYEGLLDQYKRLDVADGLSFRDVGITRPASIPTSHSSPKIASTMSKFLFFGLLVGGGLVLLLSWLDRSIKNPDVVEERLELPTLATIPFLGGRKSFTSVFSRKKRQPLPLTTKQPDKQAGLGREAFHYLRTSLQYSTAEHPPCVLMVTSCLPMEGKSTICSNLALNFSGKGEKTLVIDADLRRPILHEAFNSKRESGLSEVLTGQKSLEEVIQPTDVPDLNFMPAGASTPSPLNLLDSRRMSELLEQLKKHYSLIILDSAPCDAVADSLVLAQKVEGACLVVRLGSTPMHTLENTVQRLRSMDTRILGVIYNRTKSEVSIGTYGYGYGHPYGYHPRTD